MIIFCLFLTTLSNAKVLAFPQEESEHEASVKVDKILRELDGNCLENTRQMMSRMKECFLRSDGSMADMESILACTARLEETVRKALNQKNLGIHDPGESQEGGRE